jgi:oxygen-independent coproporphyrinogen-3 oxidase
VVDAPSFKKVLDEARARASQLNLERLRELGVWQDVAQYYLIGTYPPLKAMETLISDDFLRGCSGSVNAYFHIPFCEQRCTFCHFAKEILPPEQRVKRYMENLAVDIERTAAKAGNPCTHTIYLGGGTPSYLRAEQITDLFRRIRSNLIVRESTEVTFELHPSLVDLPDYTDRLDAMVEAGVNRWVFGVQSMDDRVLNKLNRGHSRKDVHTLLGLLETRGAHNVSVDLIFGLPHQTLENWYSTIVELLDAGVRKFNIFPLMFKQADPITVHYRREPEIFPDNHTRLLMHFMVEVIMEHYRFSRGPVFYYAAENHHSLQQESKYDTVEEVNLLPFGVSGFGFVDTTQYYNHCTIDDYCEAVESGRPVTWSGWKLEEDERQRRAVMFAVRSGGVNRKNFENKFSFDPLTRFGGALQPYIDQGLLKVTDDEITLTDAGVPFADSIAITLSSDAVRERVRAANKRSVSLKLDVVDRHDYSPLERAPVGATVDPTVHGSAASLPLSRYARRHGHSAGE